MFSVKAENIYDVAKPFHVCSQIFSLTSFSIKQRSGKFAATLNCFNIFFMVLFTTCHASYIAFLFSNIKEVSSFRIIYLSEVYENSLIVLMFCYLLYLPSSSFWFFFKRQNLATIFNMIQSVDDQLFEMGVPLNFRKHKKFVLNFAIVTQTVVILSVIFLIFINQNIGYEHLRHLSVICPLYSIISTNLGIIVTYHFTFWMWAVKLRFQKINIFLKETFKSGKRVENEMEALNKAAKLHDKLVDITECINQCYGFPVKSCAVVNN